MKREDIEKLLGGYATGTLTDQEQQALFAAAVDDQTLFNALVDEEALREALAEPVARRRLLEALGPVSPPVSSRFSQWLRQPSIMALAGTAAAAVIIGVVWQQYVAQPPHAAVEVAKLEDQQVRAYREPVAAVPAPQPARSVARRNESQPERERPASPPPPPVAAPAVKPPEPVAGQNATESDRAALARQFQAGAINAVNQAKEQKAEAFDKAAPVEERSAKLAKDLSRDAEGGRGNVVGAVAGAAAPSSVATAFRADEMSARKAKASSPALASALADSQIQYRLIRDNAEVAAGAKLAAGDRVQFAIGPGQAGYLYVFLHDTAGWRTLEAGRQINLAATVRIPEIVPIVYAPDMRMLLLRARTRIPDLEVPQPGNTIERLLKEPMGDGRTWVVVHLGTQ